MLEYVWARMIRILLRLKRMSVAVYSDLKCILRSLPVIIIALFRNTLF